MVRLLCVYYVNFKVRREKIHNSIDIGDICDLQSHNLVSGSGMQM